MSITHLQTESTIKNCLNEERKVKSCQYPGCKEIFTGRGAAKYCQEHKKKQYHQELYFDKYKKQEDINIKESNQIIKHHNCESFKMKSVCSLPKCGVEFYFDVHPRVFIYPRFCENHRSEFKRQIWMQKVEKELSR